MAVMLGPWQIIFFALGVFALPIIALVDIVKHEFTNNNKIVWLLIVLLLPLAGGLDPPFYPPYTSCV